MQELKGFEEKKGTRREKSVAHEIIKDRRSWLEQKEEREARVGYDEQPYCVIVGGGQGGIGLAARLRRLGVPTRGGTPLVPIAPPGEDPNEGVDINPLILGLRGQRMPDVGGIMTVSSHQEHDDAVHAEHEAALARGEQRVLYLTEDGMLHSYTKTELGGPPNGSTRWWQNLPGLLFLLPMFGLSMYVVITNPVGTASAQWATLFGAVLMALGAVYLIWEMVVVYRGRKERIRRGSPDPLRISGAKTKLPESYTQSQPIKKSRW